MQQTRTLRPMGLLEIVDQTLRLYRANFWLFFGIAALLYLPVGLLAVVPGMEAVSFGVAGLFYLLTYGALTKAVSDRYLGQAIDVKSSYRHVLLRILPFLGTILVTVLFVCSGVILLIVGAFVFACWSTFVAAVFMIEDKRYLAAVWRSRFLAGKGVWAEVLAIGFVIGALASVVQYAVMIPAMLVVGATSAGGVSSFTPLTLIAGLAIGAAQALVMPLSQISFILLYYDSRIRKEGFDLQVLAREMGVTLPAPQPVGAAAVVPPVAPAPPAMPPSPTAPSPSPAAVPIPPAAIQPSPPAWTPSDPRLASRLPVSALRRILIFTDSDGRATTSSPTVIGMLQDTAEAPLAKFTGRVPIDIAAQSDAGVEVARTRALPESVWAYMSQLDPELAAKARSGACRTCVRCFEDPTTREQGVILMMMMANGDWLRLRL